MGINQRTWTLDFRNHLQKFDKSFIICKMIKSLVSFQFWHHAAQGKLLTTILLSVQNQTVGRVDDVQVQLGDVQPGHGHGLTIFSQLFLWDLEKNEFSSKISCTSKWGSPSKSHFRWNFFFVLVNGEMLPSLNEKNCSKFEFIGR